MHYETIFFLIVVLYTDQFMIFWGKFQVNQPMRFLFHGQSGYLRLRLSVLAFFWHYNSLIPLYSHQPVQHQQRSKNSPPLFWTFCYGVKSQRVRRWKVKLTMIKLRFFSGKLWHNSWLKTLVGPREPGWLHIYTIRPRVNRCEWAGWVTATSLRI